ncbi:MAG: hypothetical protein O7C70_05250 [Candidatus Dadabacteria bacterium]|nr:hypothetical protein [Candidatus Dadabacteria bacterium]MCZ6864598.1 hypothetical protein [Candidatus Dadabacteria bacterium]
MAKTTADTARTMVATVKTMAVTAKTMAVMDIIIDTADIIGTTAGVITIIEDTIDTDTTIHTIDPTTGLTDTGLTHIIPNPTIRIYLLH